MLKKLNLNGASRELRREANVRDERKHKKLPAKKKVIKSEPKPQRLPTRRSRRLRGEAAEGEGVPNVNDSQLMKRDSPEVDLEQIKDTPIAGDIKLSDIIKSEDKDELLTKFQKFSNQKFSSGDFFKELQKHKRASPEIEQLQEDFDLQLYEIFEPNEIKIVQDRVTAMFFHPQKDKKLIIAGDTSGNVGLWNVLDKDPEDDLAEPDITKFKLFTKNVGRIDCFPTDSSKILTASYDGIIRSIHLGNLQSEEILKLRNEYDDYLGISDCQFSYENPNHLYISTLSGEFTILDTRAKPSSISLHRLADKKIGSFSINPQKPYEIATGSLDRTLKIWDLRNTVKNPEWSQYEDYPSHEIVSTYSSRLSVSAVSYSPMDNTLVCNGYDDTIRLFDVGGELSENLEPKLTLKHNCQTGRWTSILKARFKPNMDVFAIANMSRAIDIYSSAGQQLAHLKTATVPAVVGWHPLRNWIAGGNSSGKVFLFTDENK